MITDTQLDQMLVVRVQAGDTSAFDLLVAKYQRRLFRLILRIIRNPAEAEDVVQETFIKAYRALSRFRGEAAFFTWLYRIGINAAKNSLQRQKLSPWEMHGERDDEAIANELALVVDHNSPDAILASKQVMLILQSAIEALPVQLRTALVLRELEGISYDGIAKIMKCPIGTVRSRISRARNIIARRLEMGSVDCSNAGNS